MVPMLWRPSRVSAEVREMLGEKPKAKRHTTSCYVPEQVQNRGHYKSAELTDEVRELEPCQICGGGD